MLDSLRPLVITLAQAYRTGALAEPVGSAAGPRSIEEAYEVQEAISAECGLATGGWKIGCTSAASQRNLGSERPIAGRLLNSRIVNSGATLSDVRMDMLIVEAEFAFRLDADLPACNDGYDEAQVVAAIGALYPAIEVVQSRFANPRVPITHMIADNAGAGTLILGHPVTGWRYHDLAGQAVTLSGPNGIIASGHGRDVLEHPVKALLWLVDDLCARGMGLKAGEIVTTGTCFMPPRLEADISVIADFGPLGTSRVRFERRRSAQE